MSRVLGFFNGTTQYTDCVMWTDSLCVPYYWTKTAQIAISVFLITRGYFTNVPSRESCISIFFDFHPAASAARPTGCHRESIPFVHLCYKHVISCTVCRHITSTFKHHIRPEQLLLFLWPKNCDWRPRCSQVCQIWWRSRHMATKFPVLWNGFQRRARLQVTRMTNEWFCLLDNEYFCLGLVTATQMTLATPAAYAQSPNCDWEHDGQVPLDDRQECESIAKQLI